MYGKLLAKSKRGKKGAGTVAASAAKAPPGYSLAPGSKKGRYRKKVAGRWQYYDPNKTSTKTHAAKVAALAESLKGAPASLTDVIHAAALGDFARASKLGMAYKANHHKIDELIGCCTSPRLQRTSRSTSRRTQLVARRTQLVARRTP